MNVEVASALAVLNIVLAVPLTWITAVHLFRESRATPRARTNLVQRAVAVTFGGIAIVASVFALVFVSNEQPTPWLDMEQTRILTRGVMLVIWVSLSIMWIKLYRNRRRGTTT